MTAGQPAGKTGIHHIVGGYPKTPHPKMTAGVLLSPRRFSALGMALPPLPLLAGEVEIPYGAGYLDVWSVYLSRPSVKRRQPLIFLRWRVNVAPGSRWDQAMGSDGRGNAAPEPRSDLDQRATAGTPFLPTQPTERTT